MSESTLLVHMSRGLQLLVRVPATLPGSDEQTYKVQLRMNDSTLLEMNKESSVQSSFHRSGNNTRDNKAYSSIVVTHSALIASNDNGN